MTLALVTFAIFICLLMAGLWAPFAISLSAMLYIFAQGGFTQGGWEELGSIGFVGWGGMNSFTLTAVPLFILMAEVLMRSGVATRVYRGLSRIVVRLPGGLLQTNIAGCAVFSAISGSSVATAAAIGTVAVPQLISRGYSPRLAAGSLAAGGTLGILIPPSIAMIIYGTFTDVSVSKLFFAGLVPGLVLTGLFMVYIAIRVRLNPTLAPDAGSVSAGADAAAPVAGGILADILPFAVLIAVTLGLLYTGIVTPTEAAAVGAAMSIAVGAIWGDLPFAMLREALRNTVRTSAALMFIVFAAFLFSYAIGIDGIGHVIAEWITAQDLSRAGLLIAIVVMFLVLGCLVNSIGMMVITIPLLHPLLLAYDIDLLWFGVILVLMIEVGQLTPPLGINLFVIQGIWPGRLEDVIRGTIPFFFLILLMVGIMCLFPELATWFPGYMSGQ